MSLRASQRNVLVVEDSATSLAILKRITTNANLKCYPAQSLDQTRRLIAASDASSYLCALVDYTLPDAPNGEAIDEVLNAGIPAIVITGRLDEKIRASVLNKDVIDYIPKGNTQVYAYLQRLLLRLEKNKQVGVLVVDDSLVSRNSMLSLLRRHNYKTYEAQDAEQGLAALSENADIKLVITDENMPNKTGVEMVTEIRRDYHTDELAIIGLSSDQSPALSARFLKSGANDYLTKPFCHEEFVCRIQQNVEHVENIETIRRVANSDYLTGLPNRRHFFETAAAWVQNPDITLSLALLDLDHFKKVNDSYGHDAGDYVLKEVAKLLLKHFVDFLPARFGGEEFCILFPEISRDEAHKRIEAFRAELSDRNLRYQEHSFQCSVSIGLTANQNTSLETLISRADALLYQAKADGRNQVVAG